LSYGLGQKLEAFDPRFSFDAQHKAFMAADTACEKEGAQQRRTAR
jgi:hypothetical protein